MPSKDSKETRTMNTKSHNVEIKKTDVTIKELFKSFLQKFKKD